MNPPIDELEAQLAGATSRQNKIDIMNALAWELREHDTKRAFSLSEAAYELARQDDDETGPYVQGLASSLAHLSYLNHYQATYEAALSQSLEASSLFEQINHSEGLPLALSTVGLTYLRLGQYSQALPYLLKALGTSKRLGDQWGIAKSLNGIGLIHVWLGHHHEASRYFLDSLHAYQHIGEANGQAVTLTNLCMNYRDLKDYEKSLEYGETCLCICRESNNKHRETMALNHLGITYVEIERFEDALVYFRQALALINHISDKFIHVSVLLNMGKALLKQNQLELGQSYLHRALAIAEDSGQQGFQFECHQALAATYRSQANFESALEHYESFHTIKERLYSEESAHRLKNLEVMYQAEGAQREAEIYQLKNVVLEQEIAERKRREEMFQGLVETAADAMVIVNRDGEIILVNALAETLFGYDREDLIGRPVETLIPEPSRRKHQNDRQAYCARPEFRPMRSSDQLYGRRKDGSVFPAEISLSPLETAEGLVVSSTIRDLTSRQQIEADRQRLEEQIRQTQKLEAIGTLAGGIAHDFNNMLGAIIGYTEMTVMDLNSHKPVGQYLQNVLVAGNRAKALVQQILTFSRQSEHERKRVSLTQVVTEALELLRASLPSTIELRPQLSPASIVVQADPTQLHQVVINLCTNAAHAMQSSHGVLEVSIDAVQVDVDSADQYTALQPGAYAQLVVRDTGHGIAPEHLEHVFEPFYTTKEVGEGTGMGLAVVHGIVSQHGGHIAVESVVGKETTFTVYLPRSTSLTEGGLVSSSFKRDSLGSSTL